MGMTAKPDVPDISATGERYGFRSYCTARIYALKVRLHFAFWVALGKDRYEADLWGFCDVRISYIR